MQDFYGSEIDMAARLISKEALSLPSIRYSNFQSIRHAIGPNCKIVMLGEASHGTQEFYEFRRDLTQALVEHEGFNLVLCEGDFPPFWRLNQYIGATKTKILDTKTDVKTTTEVKCEEHLVQNDDGTLRFSGLDASSVRLGHKNSESAIGQSPDISADYDEVKAMRGLKDRFPRWMWHNEPFRELIQWLKAHNATSKVSTALLGLDIYSLFASADEVIKYLSTADPELAKIAILNYSTLNSFRDDAHEYTYCLAEGTVEPQAIPVARVLQEMMRKQMELEMLGCDGDAFFSGSENAHVVKAAEAYYRKSFMGGVVTWNLRDSAMADFVDSAIKYMERRFPNTQIRVIIWAHNSHLGDSAATDKEKRFSTDTGTVRAAAKWGAADEVMDLIPSLPESHGDLFHRISRIIGKPDFGLFMRTNEHFPHPRAVTEECLKELTKPRIQRFIGVQYVKRSERQSHYIRCNVSKQYDLVIHMDKTSALEPVPEGRPKKAKIPLHADYSRWNKYAKNDSDESESIDDITP